MNCIFGSPYYIVDSKGRGSKGFGIKISKSDRDTHFDRNWTKVEVIISGKNTCVSIRPGFWNKCTELVSPEIEKYFEKEGYITRNEYGFFNNNWEKGRPPRFFLEILGPGKFELKP
jgi:hypothetical protein